MSKAVTCPKCGNGVLVSQPDDHHEYVPTGRCLNCDALVVLANHYSLKSSYPIVVE